MHRMICVWFSTFSVSGQLSKTWMMNIACSTVPEAPSPTTQWLMPSLRGWRSSLLFLLMGPWSIIRYLAWFVFSWQNHNLLLNFDWSMSCVCWLLSWAHIAYDMVILSLVPIMLAVGHFDFAPLYQGIPIFSSIVLKEILAFILWISSKWKTLPYSVSIGNIWASSGSEASISLKI